MDSRLSGKSSTGKILSTTFNNEGIHFQAMAEGLASMTGFAPPVFYWLDVTSTPPDPHQNLTSTSPCQFLPMGESSSGWVGGLEKVFCRQWAGMGAPRNCSPRLFLSPPPPRYARGTHTTPAPKEMGSVSDHSLPQHTSTQQCLRRGSANFDPRPPTHPKYKSRQVFLLDMFVGLFWGCWWLALLGTASNPKRRPNSRSLHTACSLDDLLSMMVESGAVLETKWLCLWLCTCKTQIDITNNNGMTVGRLPCITASSCL